jgi:5-formyltetrahydrofolate cyclo-ligase
MIMKKDKVRKIYLQMRQELSSLEYEERSSNLVQNTIELIKKFKPKCVHCFLSISVKQEINTMPIIEYCWTNNINVVVPITDFANNTLKSAQYTPQTLIHQTRYNIPEPTNPVWGSDEEIDMVITPLLAFDSEGHRVGFGKGFYDRLFSSLSKNTRRVGVSLFDACEGIDDINKYDMPLTHCVTPKESLTF